MNTEANKARPWDGASDEEWLDLLIRSVEDASLGLPGFPTERTQMQFVGRTGGDALREAFAFYKVLRPHLGEIAPDAKMLDFGVGWGRCLRTWMRDFQPKNMFGVDVDTKVLHLSVQLGVPGTLFPIEPMGEMRARGFTLIESFSVFSHLSEEGARHWLRRLVDALEPGGVFGFTTCGQRLVDMCSACYDKPAAERNSFETDFAELFADPHAVRASYMAGNHVYAAVGGGGGLKAENYGWAAIPPAWVEREIGPLVQSVEYVIDPGVEQPIYIIKK